MKVPTLAGLRNFRRRSTLDQEPTHKKKSRTMPALPRIVLRLEERLDGATKDLGAADLTMAVCDAVEDGARWDTDQVPATVEVCKALSHPAREAAWRGSLYAPGLAEAFETFKALVGKKSGGCAAFSFKLSVLQAARRVESHAAWLMDAVLAARIAPWPKDGKVSHPLSGETMSSIEANAVSSMPFAFACTRVKFSGIDPVSLADFLADGCDESAVRSYLETFLKSPEVWLKDVEILETACNAWLVDRDFAALSEAVESWNALQDVSPLVADPTTIVLFPGVSLDEAVTWCRDHLRKSRDLVTAVSQGL